MYVFSFPVFCLHAYSIPCMYTFLVFCMHAFFILCMHALFILCMHSFSKFFILCMNAFFTCLTCSIHLMHACICIPLFWQMWPHVPWGRVDVIISVRWVLRVVSTAAAEQDGSSVQTKEPASVKHTTKLLTDSYNNTHGEFFLYMWSENLRKIVLCDCNFNWLSAKEKF